MKFHSNTALPYPVIADKRDDYLDSFYNVESNVLATNNEVIITLKHSLSPYDIEKLITYSTELSFAVIIRCRSTFYKKVFFSQDKDQVLRVDSLQLRDDVWIEPYIVARKRTRVSSKSLNQEYGTQEIDYESGDVIAKALERKFIMSKDAFKPLESIFKIIKDEKLEEGEWELDAEPDKLELRVSPKLHELESNIRSTKLGRAVLLNSIYYAAVVEAIQVLKEDPMDTKWAKVLKSKMAPLGIDLERIPSYKIANILLNKPALRLSDIDFELNS